MVVNLCLPHFSTTVHCNKLCADGYDVTNLLSADPALRRRGFKLEYFLRPPVEVTLTFGFQVELCRVDVELWPWGMDKGQACKRLEISTSSNPLPSQTFSQVHKQVKLKQEKCVIGKDQNEQPVNKKKSFQSNGHQWSNQAQHWAEESPDKHQKRGRQYQSETESCNPEFKLVGRCELREETKVCFTRSNFSPHAPFLSPPPPQPASCQKEDLWSRGLLSLGAVTQLRVTVPFGGAASALGLKSLAVWGQPARCCPAEEVERIRIIHESSERRTRQPVFLASSFRPTTKTTATPASNLSIPEEFLDPITQEVMMLPMLLPCGVSVDSSTLEEYQKREATWGRPPNDPFTGVPFTSTSHALPNPQLKIRIDQFVLQKGLVRRDGMLGRQDEGDNPQASRLIATKVGGQLQNSSDIINNSKDNSNSKHHKMTERTTRIQDSGSGHSSHNVNNTSNSQTVNTNSELEATGWRKRDVSGVPKKSAEETADRSKLVPQAKRPRSDAGSSCSSHEQRLSTSLDEALFSALQGRPSFTSTLSRHKTPSMLGEMMCSTCSCSVSVYSTSASSIYRLACGHLLCYACLQKETQSLTPHGTNQILCSTCHSSTPRTDVIRVHY